MPVAGVVTIVAVVLIVLALVFYLVSTILALRRISAGLDEVIAGVGEIVDKIAAVAAAGSKDLDSAALLLTTQEQVEQTVAGVAAYGGSLDVILDDAGPA